MSAIATKLAMAATSTAVVMGLAVAPVAAGSTTTVTTTTNTDKSVTVTGDCSGVIFSEVEQSSSQGASNSAQNTAGNINVLPILPIGNEQNNTVENNQSNSQSNSQSNTVTFAPDCSVTNVTNAAEVKAAQVEAPKGGVDAGAGATGSLLGLGGSLTAAAAGALRLFRRGQ